MKKIITSLSLIVLILLTLTISTQSSIAEDESRFVIAYSNNVEAYLEPCG